MTEQNELHIEDVEEAVRACRPVRSYGPWRIRIGDEHLDFRPAVLDDPVPIGLQFLELADARPPEEYMIFQLLGDGTLEELRATETVDLRNGGVERFLVFRGSASYRFELDGRVIEWGKPMISGLVLKKLAGVDPATYGVCRESIWGLRRTRPQRREVASMSTRSRGGWGRSRASGGPGLVRRQRPSRRNRTDVTSTALHALTGSFSLTLNSISAVRLPDSRRF